jgi:protein-S-isoprenylcysteine O-methyltransferase Ste14
MIPPNDERPPKQRNLRIASFATHATRGILRDEQTRRKVMFGTIFMAVVMLFCGATFLAPVLDPRIRLGWFVVYWLACAWITVTAVLLAIFDLLLVRLQARDEKRALARKIADGSGEVE